MIVRNGSRLGVTDKLESIVKVGDTVIVDISSNSDSDNNVLLLDAGSRVASAVYLDEVQE